MLLAAVLSACAPQPLSAEPALWRIDGRRGAQGWLFGTIHALDRPADWRTPPVAGALAASDRIVVEIAAVADEAATARVFQRLSRRPGLPPLAQRVPPELRPALTRSIERHRLTEAQLADVETWAAALSLARAPTGPVMRSEYGVDRAVVAAAAGRPVLELEGAERQLGIFDRLPEREQRDLLVSVLQDPAAIEDPTRLLEAWRKGDMAIIEAETRNGALGDPGLRKALLTGRNRSWTAQIAGLMRRGRKPFVAVGAAHMAGREGLPALLAKRGYRVTRVQ